MEKFKAVEKEMKTKAFSKEGLNAPGKRDPKEQEKEDAGQFLSDMIAELERQIESMEAEEEQLQSTAKKGKKDPVKAERLSDITKRFEGHRFHIGKLELLRRALENGNVETEKVQERKDDIEYYVNDNQSPDFVEEAIEDIYTDLDLEEDEGGFGLANDNDRLSSQDTQSMADDMTEPGDRAASASIGSKPKSSSVSESQSSGARRPSNAVKSPLPALATLHTPMPAVSNPIVKESMKPAPLPTRPPGETLKYASAAAAAAATSEKAALGIAPLPPPPSSAPAPVPTSTTLQATTTAPSAPPGLSALPQLQKSKTTPSPKITSSLPATSISLPPQNSHVASEESEQPSGKTKIPTNQLEIAGQATQTSNHERQPSPDQPAHSKEASVISKPVPSMNATQQRSATTPSDALPRSNQPVLKQVNGDLPDSAEEESIYHLPPGLQDLIQSFEITKRKAPSPESPSIQRLFLASHGTKPDYLEGEKPHHYQPDTKYSTPSYYPQEPFANVDDPSLYNKVDTDTLFYIFYYRQNTYQQYMAAKALKSQSWRFHKQYQTWFQRHEEPKTITEEFEQGTYRFFDYESTW